MIRKILLSFAFIVFFYSFSVAAVLYVSSARTSLYRDASRGSGKITTVRKGARLTVMTKRGQWIKVKFRNKRGWIQKLFTSKRKPRGRASILGSAGKKARIHARKRASYNVTAASARGLREDDPAAKRARLVNAKSRKYDPNALSKMEGLYISEEKLMEFLKQGGIK